MVSTIPSITSCKLAILVGIMNTRISYKGYGDTKPIDDNNTEEGRHRNRRVEFKILKK